MREVRSKLVVLWKAVPTCGEHHSNGVRPH